MALFFTSRKFFSRSIFLFWRFQSTFFCIDAFVQRIDDFVEHIKRFVFSIDEMVEQIDGLKNKNDGESLALPN